MGSRSQRACPTSPPRHTATLPACWGPSQSLPGGSGSWCSSCGHRWARACSAPSLWQLGRAEAKEEGPTRGSRQRVSIRLALGHGSLPVGAVRRQPGLISEFKRCSLSGSGNLPKIVMPGALAEPFCGKPWTLWWIEEAAQARLPHLHSEHPHLPSSCHFAQLSGSFFLWALMV